MKKVILFTFFYVATLFAEGALPQISGGCEPGVTIEFSSGAPLCTNSYELTSFNWETGDGKCVKRQSYGSPVVTNACQINNQAWVQMLNKNMETAATTAKATASKKLEASLAGNVSIPSNPPPTNLSNVLLSCILMDGNASVNVQRLQSITIGGTYFKSLIPTMTLYSSFFGDAQTYIRTSATLIMAFTAGFFFYSIASFANASGADATKNKLYTASPSLALALILMFAPLGGGQNTMTHLLINKYMTDSVNSAYSLSVKFNNAYMSYLKSKLDMGISDAPIKQFAAKEAAFNEQKKWIANAQNICRTRVNCGNLNRYTAPQAYSCEFCSQVDNAMIGIDYANKLIPIQKAKLQTAYDAQFAAHAQVVQNVQTANKQAAEALGLFQIAYLPSLDVFVQNSVAGVKEANSAPLQIAGSSASGDRDEVDYQNKINIQDAYLNATADQSFWSKVASIFKGDEAGSSLSLPTDINRKGADVQTQVMGDSFYMKPFAAAASAAPYFWLPGANGAYSMVTNAVNMVPSAFIPTLFEKVSYGDVAYGTDAFKRDGGFVGWATEKMVLAAGIANSVSSGVSTVASKIPDPRAQAVGAVANTVKGATDLIIEPIRLLTSIVLTAKIMKMAVDYLPILATQVTATVMTIMFMYDLMLFKIVSLFIPLYAFTLHGNTKIKDFFQKGASLFMWPFSLVISVMFVIVFASIIDTVFVGLVKYLVTSIYNLSYANLGDSATTPQTFMSKVTLLYFVSFADILGALAKIAASIYIISKTHDHTTTLIILH